MKKLILIGICMLLIIPFVLGQFIYEQNELVDIKVPCFYNEGICTGGAWCNVTILYPDNTVLIDNENTTHSGVYFNYTLLANQTTQLGEYQAIFICSDSGQNDSTTFPFIITPSGTQASTSQGIIYSLLFFSLLIFLLVCVYGAIIIDGDNKYDTGGGILLINYRKHLKAFLWFISYVIFLFTSMLSWKISENFLYLDFLTSTLYFFFRTLLVLFFPIFFLYFVITIVRLLLDFKLHKLARRNLGRR